MFKNQQILINPQKFAFVQELYLQTKRFISALYITGNKATENYVTLQPYMNFESTLSPLDTAELENNIKLRKLNINLNSIHRIYEQYKAFQNKIHQLQKQREMITNQLKVAMESTASLATCNQLKEEGITFRNQLKQLKENLYPIEDEFVHSYLNLPNKLHRECPNNYKEKILYRNSIPYADTAESHLKRTDLIHFIDNNRYYLLKEAAEFDIHATHAFANDFIDRGDFYPMSNPDFVRCVLLEANSTPLEQYHLVKEQNLLNKINTAHLTGGAAFESFLGAITKLVIYPNILPLRFISTGRIYHKIPTTFLKEMTNNLYTTIQTNAVQTFVATQNAQAAEQEMENILNLCIDFYRTFNVHFRIIYADASALTIAECLRAIIEIYSPAQQRYVCVGHVSNYSDFVSKRILFTMRQKKDYHFLHLVGGPILYTTRLIATLIENDISLAKCKFLKLNKKQQLEKQEEEEKQQQKAIDDFKNIFK